MHPIEIDATLKLAKSKLRSGSVAEAEGMYRKVLETQPQCAEAVHFLGLAAMQRGKLEQALDLIRKSIELEPRKAEYHNNLATVLGRLESLGWHWTATAFGGGEYAYGFSGTGPAPTGAVLDSTEPVWSQNTIGAKMLLVT